MRDIELHAILTDSHGGGVYKVKSKCMGDGEWIDEIRRKRKINQSGGYLVGEAKTMRGPFGF